MNFIKKWLFKPRTFGSNATKESTVDDELTLMGPFERAEFCNALEIALGKEWKMVPTRKMMDLINLRFDGKVRDYSHQEIYPVMHLLKNHSSVLDTDQVKFIREFDHLPKSKEKGIVWMSGKELNSYANTMQDAIHKKKMDYFIMMNGITMAHAQAMSGKSVERPPFKLSPTHVMIIVGVVAAAIIGFLVLHA